MGEIVINNRIWSPTLTLGVYFGVQRFSFGRFLEFNALALKVFWSSLIPKQSLGTRDERKR